MNSMEKRLLFAKFYEEKTDTEIARTLGITQQAVSRAKRLLLDKLKSHLEI
ncbi:sigma factor-like helix-turn-helix DNA-binding protein [Paenibacillus sp. YN15]|uniref:sigma factor-like helix-turn-helix DNA-binding protein n=1 Tax=Paenibacillus sp. YN15 TaxID=1742774 RepID=UPI0015EB5EEF